VSDCDVRGSSVIDADGSGEIAGYRPVSALAMAAAVSGAVSTLALTGPVFWVLPLVGVALSCAALFDVGRPGAPKAGRLAALAGLALALGFGMQAVATAATAEWLSRGRAETAARFWLDAVVAGRHDDATGMCGPDAVEAVDRVAACGSAAPARVRCGGRDEETGGRVVHAVVGDCAFEVVITALPPQRAGEPERLTITRCTAVTPSAS